MSTSFLAPLRHLAGGRLALALSLALALPAQAAVLISQVYGGGGNAGAPYTNDFVELCNNGPSAVSLSGWSIQYASSAGTSWSNTTPLTGSIPAGGFLLIQLASGGANGVALPAPDVTGGINMSASAGKMALFNTTTVFTGGACPVGNAALQDIVGYGTATNCFQGAGPAPQLSNLLAAKRASCSTTLNNNADFTAVAPDPRNSGGGGGGGPGIPVAAAIHAIQGSGATSPLVGQPVVTSGVVTHLAQGGFYI
jgi:uncharacterized protein